MTPAIIIGFGFALYAMGFASAMAICRAIQLAKAHDEEEEDIYEHVVRLDPASRGRPF